MQTKLSTPSTKQLQQKAKQFYPRSKHMQSTWVERTLELYKHNKHAFQTGGWAREGFLNE